MFSSLAGILVTPAAAVIGLVCFLVSGGLLAVLIVLLVLSVLYLLFLVWLIIGFGSNSGPPPTPH